MIKELSQREKRTVMIGAVCAAAILVFVFASKWYDRWAEARGSLDELNAKLELIDVDKARRAGLMSIVPVFKMPEKEETQRFLFRDKLTEQLKEAKINNKPLQELPGRKSSQAGYKLLRLKCSANCKFTQVLDLLANLKNNPYLVGIEELKITVDKKKPQEVEMELTVSTFVQ